MPDTNKTSAISPKKISEIIQEFKDNYPEEARLSVALLQMADTMVREKNEEVSAVVGPFTITVTLAPSSAAIAEISKYKH